MDVDLLPDETIIYLIPEEVEELYMGNRVMRPSVEGTRHCGEDKESITNVYKSITIESPVLDIKDVEYYDDTLEALRKSSQILKRIRNGEIPGEKEAEKISNTYRYYKKQQEKYL